MIIGLSGYAGVGKDTVAKYITEIDSSFKIKKFSGKLKQVASMLTGIPEKNFESQDFKNTELAGWDMTARELLQKLGTEAIRDCLHKDAWVNALFSDYHQGENWIITDVRFPNEYYTIYRWNGINVRLERDGVKPINAHESETALDEFVFNYKLVNMGGIDRWKTIAEYLLNEINEK